MDGRVSIAYLAVEAHTSYTAGRYRDAAAGYESALAIDEAGAKLRPLERASLLNGLAVCYKYLAQFDAAVELYKEALQLTEQELGASHPDVATVWHNLGGLEHSRGRFADGEPYARLSVQIREAALGPDHVNVAADLGALAGLLDGLRRFEQSEPIYLRALGIFERAYGRDHIEVGICLGNLAALKYAQGRLGEAKPLYRRALELKERHLGMSHPSVGVTLNNMGVLYLSLGDYVEAAAMFQRALLILKAALGTSHPSVAKCRKGVNAAARALAAALAARSRPLASLSEEGRVK